MLKNEQIVDVVDVFNGPLGTRLSWVVVEVRGETKGRQVRLSPEEARALGVTYAADLAALDNAVKLGGAL